MGSGTLADGAPVDDETPKEKIERLRSRLTEQQRRFCEVYLEELDAGLAYNAAYGSQSTYRGNEVLGKWYIQDYLAALTEAGTYDDIIVTKTEVLAQMATIMRHGGEDKDRIAAAKLISHVRGFGVKKVEHSGSVKRDGLTDDEVLQVRAKFLGVDPEELVMVESNSPTPAAPAEDDA